MSDDDEVGYGKPPKASQFKPGQSGNPKGRPKGTLNLKSDLIDELQERVVIREGASSTQVSKQKAMIKRLITKSINGDTRSLSIALNLMLRLLEPGSEGDPTEPLDEQEREILETLKARLAQRTEANDGAESDDIDEPDEPDEPDPGQAD